MNADIAHNLICAICGGALSEEECESPYTVGDEPICDGCRREHYCWTCDRCEEDEHVDLQHYYLIVYEETPGGWADVIPGIYYIKDGPYHGGSMFAGHLFAEQLLRLRDLPPDAQIGQDGYPCGHLCRHCVEKLRLPTTQEYRDLCAKVNT